MAAGTAIWLDDPYTPRPPLDRDLDCDVCIVGAGVGGLSAAWHLLAHDVRACVIEADVVAGGASGRNGGFFIAGVAPSHLEACGLWGREVAARRHRATLVAQAEMLSVAAAVGARDHFLISGILRLAVDDAEAAQLRENLEALRRDGFPGELVSVDDLPAAVRRPGRLGLLTRGDGAVHPVRWLRALAGALEERGVAIHERTPAAAPVASTAGVVVRTPSALVRARRVIVAVDGGLAGLIPSAHRVRPRRLNMLATAPVEPGVLPLPVYARHGHEYLQQLPGGEITLGGFSDVDGDAGWTDSDSPSRRVEERLAGYLVEELGVLAPVTHRWAGVVGYAADPVPICGAVPGTGGRILAAGGYNGTGHVQGFVCGRILAELAATGSSPDADLYAPVV